MKKMVCEVCGSSKIRKNNDIFVCGECGTEYSLEAARKLLKDIDVIDTPIIVDEEETEPSNYMPTNPKTKKKLIIIISFIALLIISIAITIPLSISSYRKNIYENLQYEMINFDRDSEVQIEKYLSKLPYDYRDVKDIMTEFSAIKKHTKNIDAAYFYRSGTTTKCVNARVDYYNLVVINNTSYRWNLTEYLNNNMRVVFFGVEWSGSGYDIKWYEKDGEAWLSTDLPNNKESDKQYYYDVDFYLDHFIFSYDNENDSTDTFDAYKIYSLTVDEEYFYVNIYCYSNGNTYKLKSKVQ